MATTMRAEMVRLLLAVAAPLVLVIAIGVYYEYLNDHRNAEATARRIADITVADIEAFLKEAREDLAALAARPQVRTMDARACDPMLAELLPFRPRYLNMLSVDREGYVVCAAKPPPGDRRVRIQDLETHRRTLDERRFQVSRPVQGRLSGRWVIALTAPVLADDGTATGSVGISIDLVGWPFIARSARLPEDTVIGVIASDGTVVARSEQAEERVGRNSRGIESVDEALAQREGSARGKGRGDRDVIFAFGSVKGTDWVVLVGIPVRYALVEWRAGLQRSAALGSVAILLATLIALALNRRITGQVRRIAETARRVAGGARGERARVESIAEIAEVATQFNALQDAQDQRGRERARMLERLELQFERMPILCVVYDERMLVSYVNPTTERVLGWSRDELLGRAPFDTFIAPERRELVEALFARLRAGEFVRASGEGLCKDGSRVLLEWVNTPLLREDGTFIGLMAMAQDVTERTHAQQMVAESEQRYRLMFESNPLPMWVVDRETQGFLAVNDAAVSHYGYSRAEFLAMTVAAIRPVADRQAISLSLSKVEAGMQRGTRTHLRKGGGTIEAEVAFQDIEFAGRPARIVLSHDITARVRAEESIRRLNAELEDRVRQRTGQLEAANRELEAFSYSVSHDLRAPLRHVDGFARRLEKALADAPAATLRDLGIIRGAARRMGELIDDLLNLSRTARAPVNVRRVELDALVRDLVAQIPPELGAAEIRWRIGALPAIGADASLMRIVLQNLLSNAVKYSRKRAVAEIEVGAQRDPQGETIVYVRDNGVGFDMRFGEKLFGVFQRLHREEEFEGTGIGLATVRRIVHRHGGRVWAEAEPDRGATFSFTVTLAEDSG